MDSARGRSRGDDSVFAASRRGAAAKSTQSLTYAIATLPRAEAAALRTRSEAQRLGRAGELAQPARGGDRVFTAPAYPVGYNDLYP